MTPEMRSKVLAEFRTNDAVAVVAKRVGVGRDRVTRVWKEEFGKDSVVERANRLRGLANTAGSNSADPEIRSTAISAFSTEEPMKKVALRLGVHYTQVRKWWVEEYGIEQVKRRGRALQKAKTRANNRRLSGLPRKIKTTKVPCEGCGHSMEVSAISASKRARFFCESCDLKRRGADLPCPVCGHLCVGKRGLSSHLRHAKDAAHLAWVEQEKKASLGEEGVDHVVCKECGHRARNLWKHLEVEHGTTPSAYVEKWPGASWRTEQSEEARSSRSLKSRASTDYSKGAQKEVACSTCGQSTTVSLFSGSLHDQRCEECKAEDELVRWRGRTEPRDFVSCKECGHRAQSLTSHLKSAHDFEEYCKKYPEAPLTALCAGQRVSPPNKLVLTKDQLRPFQDDQGRVIAAAAAKAFACAQHQIRRNCSDLGLKTRSRIAWQKAVLDNAAAYLRCSYKSEWKNDEIFNESTGRQFRFDGYFPSKNLIIEAHGEQHFYFIESWHKTHDEFERLQELDRYKVARARELGYEVKIVRYSDPIHDKSFWKELLGGSKSLWANKSAAEKESDVNEVLAQVRQEGFPKIPVSPKTKAEFTKLCSQEMTVDDEGFVRPYTVRGTTSCASFFPNRYDARYRGAPSVREAWEDDGRLRSAIRVQLNAGHPTTGPRVLKALQMICRTPSVFRPGVAKFVYDEYCSPGGVVWDPCAGYGGRLMGAMASGIGLYLGTDVEPATVEGNERLARELGYEDRCELVLGRAEDFDPERELDLVFTSPPYFDLEVYGEASKKALSQENIEEWLRCFLVPVVRTAFARLREGGHLVLNLPTKPLDGVVLSDEAVKIAASEGLSVLDPVYMPVRRLKSGHLRSDPLLVFRR